MTPDRIIMLSLMFALWALNVLITERRVKDRDWPAATRSAFFALVWSFALVGSWLKVAA